MTHPLLTIRLALKRLYDHEMSPIMAQYDLTRMELDVLIFLQNNPGCDTAAEIVQLRMMTKSHVSKAVEHLTARGFITQARDVKNRRRIHLSLTDSATPVLTRAQEAMERVNAIMNEGVSPEDAAILARVMDRISQNILHALDE